MNARRLAAALCFAGGAVFLARCPDSNVVTGPAVSATAGPAPARSVTVTRTPAASSTPLSPTLTPIQTVTPLGPAASLHGTGSVTWTSITTTRAPI